MTRQLLLLIGLVVLVSAPRASAQTVEVVGSTLAIGTSPASPTDSSVSLKDLATTGGSDVLLIDTTTWGVRRRLLGKSDLPGTVGYTDEAETWSLLQTFTSGLTSNGLLTIGGANDLLLGAGGMRVASGSILLRNIADSADIATFGDAAIALNQPTTITGNSSVTGTWGVSGLSTLTGGFSAGASSSIVNNLTLTGTGNITAAGDVAINGGDLTSTAATFNIDAAGTVQINDTLVMAASNTLRSANFASRTTGWGITYAGFADVRGMYAEEFYTKNFIADLETALNGGQIIAKSTVVVARAFTCPAAGAVVTGVNGLRVRDFPGHTNMRVFAVNDWVVLRTMTRADANLDGNIEFSIADCVGQVSAYADETDDTQTWTFTRGSGGSAGAMTASTVIAAEALAIDYGVSGQGFLVARANDGTEGSQSPYWQAVTWTTAPVAANMSLQTRWGNLNGSYGYATPTYGFAAGDSADVFVATDPTNGLRIMEGGTNQKVRIDPTGYVLIGQTGATQSNVYVSNTQLALRTATADLIKLSSAVGLELFDTNGVRRALLDTAGLKIYRSGGTAAITLDASNGATFTGDGNGVTNINGGNIQTGTVTANQISVGFSADNLIANGRFESGIQGWAWVEGTNTTAFASSTSGVDGAGTLYINPSAGQTTAVGFKSVPVEEGATYYVRLNLYHNVGSAAGLYVRMSESNANALPPEHITSAIRTSLTDLVSNGPITAGFNWYSYIYTVPAGVKTVSLSVYNWTCVAGTCGYYLVDGVQMIKRTGTLNAVSASLGTIDIATNGYLRSTGTAYGGTGIFLGYDSTAYKFSVGDATKYMRWDGSRLSLNAVEFGASASSIGSTGVGGTTEFSSSNAHLKIGATGTGYDTTIGGINSSEVWINAYALNPQADNNTMLGSASFRYQNIHLNLGTAITNGTNVVVLDPAAPSQFKYMAGWSGTCSAASFTVQGGIITSC